MARLPRFTPTIAATAIALALTAGPLAAADLATTIGSDSRFTILTQALRAAQMEDTFMNAGGPITLFAPTDAAFRKLPAGTIDTLLQPQNRERLRTLLRQHISFQSWSRSALNIEGPVPTGNLLRVPVRGLQNPVQVGPARIEGGEIRADNAIIHAIDTVLVPPERRPARS
jgi:uncharacterized surface protein with fasciclin (FAS1) repeats